MMHVGHASLHVGGRGGGGGTPPLHALRLLLGAPKYRKLISY